MTYELTGALADHVSLGFMQLNAVLPGTGFQYAGWRVLPHFYAPRSWHLPVDLGLVVEFSFARPQYIPETAHVEIRPIIERTIKDFQLDLNPVFARALRGENVGAGWHFEPAARVAYGDAEKARFRPYRYSEIGYLPDFPPLRQQVHQIYPGTEYPAGEESGVEHWNRRRIDAAGTPPGDQIAPRIRIRARGS